MIRASNAYEDKRNEILKILRRYRASVNNYRACKELYDLMFPSGTQLLSDMPRGGTNTYEPERWAIKRIDQQERMKASLEKMREEYEDVEKMIDQLDGNYNTVLVRMYLLGEPSDYIARKMSCSRKTVWNWHNKAIDKITKHYTLLHS